MSDVLTTLLLRNIPMYYARRPMSILPALLDTVSVTPETLVSPTTVVGSQSQTLEPERRVLGVAASVAASADTEVHCVTLTRAILHCGWRRCTAPGAGKKVAEFAEGS